MSVTVEGKSIQAVCHLPVGDAQTFFSGLTLNKRDEKIAVRILKEVRERLSFLEAVGLDYLNLDRSSATLSGGEAQRIRLATQIGSALQGVIYVLDETIDWLASARQRASFSNAQTPARFGQLSHRRRT